MNNSNLSEENKKKIEEAVKEAINKSEVKFDDKLIDISEFDDEILKFDDENVSKKSDESVETSDSKRDAVNEKKTNDDSGEKEQFVSNDDKGSDFLNQIKQGSDDLKKSNGKKDLMPGEKLGEKPMIPDEMKKAADDIKEAAKPVVDEAKKALNQVKEKGKEAAAKAGGKALNAVTKGILPEKVGEKISKKALDKAEKKIKKKTNKIKNEISKKTQKVKEKIGDKGQKISNKVSDVMEKAGKAVKFIKFIEFMQKWGPVILAVVAVFIVIAGVLALTTIIQSYLPGAFGDVNQETDSEIYSKRDQRILEDIEEKVKKYPNLSTNDAAKVMATVSYPYHFLLQDQNVTAMLDSSTDDEETTDVMELLFEDDSNLTFSERYEKYTAMYQGITGAVGDIIEEDFKNWYYETFGYEFDETEDEDNAENDMYLTMYKKNKYIKNLDELLQVYSSQGEGQYVEYLKNNYFVNEDGFKKMFKGVTNDEDIALLQASIINDIGLNAEMYEKYIPIVQICTVSTQSAGSVEVDDVIKSGNILVDVKEESCTNPNAVDSCASMQGMPISLKEYVIGVVHTEISVDENTSMDKIKTQMIMVKSFVLGRYKEMGWELKQTSDGAYVLPIRANTNDQDYCDYKVGCVGKLSGNKHAAASEKVQEMYEQAWNETVNEYIYDADKSRPVAFYKTHYDKYCIEGACLISSNFDADIASNLNYKQILAKAFRNLQMIIIEPEGYASIQVAGKENCQEVYSGTGGIPDHEFIYYDQKDFTQEFCGRTDGSTIATSGCGVTSMAMVIANLTYESSITPVETMNEAQSGGYCGNNISGTNAGYFDAAAAKYGLEITKPASNYDGANEVIEILKKGGLVIAHVNANSPFTKGGHYIVIRKVDAQGNIYVADPNHKELFYTAYNINDFINKSYLKSGWYAFTGPKSSLYEYKVTTTGEPGIATGYLGNPFNPQDTIANYMSWGNASSFPRYNSGSCHGGVDFGINTGTTVYASDGGIVRSVNDFAANCYGSCSGNNSYGILVTIDHRNGYITRYAHLSQRLVNVGDTVAKGQLIGYSGNSGNSSGPHLHMELEKSDLLSMHGRDSAKCTSGKGLLNPAAYINKEISYVGQTK